MRIIIGLVVVTNIFGKDEGATQGVGWWHGTTKLGSIYTLDRCVHVQFIGSNDGMIKHAVGCESLPAAVKKAVNIQVD